MNPKPPRPKVPPWGFQPLQPTPAPDISNEKIDTGDKPADLAADAIIDHNPADLLGEKPQARSAAHPSDQGRKGLAQVFRDIRDSGLKAGAWEGAAAVADAVVAPGAGVGVRIVREGTRLLGTAKSLNDGHGADFRIPIASDDLGLTVGCRIRLFEAHPKPLPDISIYTNVDRDAPEYREVMSLEEVPPAARSTESTQPREPYHHPSQMPSDRDPAPSSGQRGVWLLDTPTGEGSRCAVVVVPHEELKKATGASEITAASLVRYVEGHTSVAGDGSVGHAALAHAASNARESEGSGPGAGDRDRPNGDACTDLPFPRVIVYADPDTQLGLVVVNPADGPAHAPHLLEINGHTDAGPPPAVAKQGSARAEGDAGAEATQSRAGWLVMFDELERFAGPAHLRVRTAIAIYAAGPIVAGALDSFGPRFATALDNLGAYAAAYLVDGVVHRGVDTSNQPAVRHALQEIIWQSLESVSDEAAECRRHVAYLLASKRILVEILKDTRADVDLEGDESRLRRVLKTRSKTDSQPDRPGGATTDPAALFEHVVEQLEYFAGLADALDAVLTSLLEELRRDDAAPTTLGNPRLG